MKNTPTEKRAAIASSDLLAVGRPPARLPNGKKNPEYTRWYRTTPQGRASVEKWNKGDGLKTAMTKYRATEKAQVTAEKRVAKKRDRNEVVREDQCKCAECGMVFDRIAAALEGFRHLPRNRYMGVCGLCNSCG